MPINREIQYLYKEIDSPINQIWPDYLYEGIMAARVDSIIERIKKNIPIASNSLNIFSAESGLPIEVSYPPFSLAKRLAADYQLWIEDLKNGETKPDALIRSYTFKFSRLDKGRVSVLNTNDFVRIGTVLFSFLTDQRPIWMAA